MEQYLIYLMSGWKECTFCTASGGNDVVLFSKPGLAWVQLVWLLLAMQCGTQSEVNTSGTVGLWIFNSC